MNDKPVRVRFAPSPTGDLHIGGARTALFNWLFARHHGGKYLLRIEDTDMERSTDESLTSILGAFAWLGMNSDEELVYQSKRRERHIEVVEKMLSEGHAYRCYCTKEELDTMRAEQKARKENPRYDGRCRNRTDGDPSQPHVIRFKAPSEGDVNFNDAVLGDIRKNCSEVDDLVLVKTGGYPAYNFAVVVDDHDMNISHVIRGDGHLANTPKQILIYRALGWDVPQFAHLPLILGSDKKPLSKRHGATSVLEFREQGFLPEALINYLARLGWAHGDQEIFSIAELQQYFDLPAVNKSPAVWDNEKLLWVNAEHIKAKTPEELLPVFADTAGACLVEAADAFPDRPANWQQALIEGQQERSKTMVEMVEKSMYALVETPEFDAKAKKKFLRPVVLAPMKDLRDKLATLSDWPAESDVEPLFQEVLEAHELKMVKLAQPVRVALTGTSVSPGIYTVVAQLGKELTLARMDRAIAVIEERAAESEG
jgi:glutamyl-tRNA synthetase